MLNPSCPRCLTALSAVDAQQQWCPTCRTFAYAHEEEPPVRLNLIIADIHAAARRHSESTSAPMQITFEQFTHPGADRLSWRCYAKLDGKLVKSSTRPHAYPGDALRELTEMLAPS